MSKSDMYASYQSIFKNIPLPFAYVDLNLLDANIHKIVQAVGNKRIRVASKSIRCPAVLKRIFAASPVFQGVMCYTAHEASYLARLGCDDLLLGYPVYQPDAIRDLVDLVGQGHSVTFMVDSILHVEQIERIARERGVRVPVCMDIDMSSTYPGLRFGVWRSPLASWVDAKTVVGRIQSSDFVWLDGVMGYEAQIAGVGDNVPGKSSRNRMVRLLKRRSIREIANRRGEVVENIKAMGISLRFVNAGGTGSIDSSRLEDVVTEITVGSGFFSPQLFDFYTSFHYQPAVGYAVEIVRKPRSDIVTCAGGGYVASGPAGNDRLPTPYLPSGLKMFPLEGAGEVQTPLRYSGTTTLNVGDPVFFRHAKAGELCERFPKLYAVANGEIVGEYETYRGAGACFL